MLELIPVDGNRRHVSKIFDTSHYQQFTPPFDLPDSWEWVRLGDISEIKGGTTIPTEQECSEGILPYIKVSDLNTQENIKEITTSNRYVNEWKESHVISKDSIVFPKRGGAIFTNKKRITRQPLLADLNLMSVHPLGCFEYVYLWFDSFKLSTIQSGSNIPQINNQDLEPLYIPLPPEKEQTRIVCTVSKLLDIIDILSIRCSNLFDKINIAKSKILELAMQGKLVPQDSADEPAADMLCRINPKAKIITDTPHYPKLPDNWVLAKLTDLANLLSGRDLANEDCNDIHEGIPYLIGASNIENGNLKFVRWSKNPQVISIKNDVLLSCKGTVGKIVLNKYGEIHIARQFMAIRCGQSILPHYLMTVLLAHISTIRKSANGIIPGISRDVLLELIIPVPPINEQMRIMQQIYLLFGILDSIANSVN